MRSVPPAPQRVGVVDAVTPRQGRHDQAQDLVAGVRPPGRVAQVEMLVDRLAETEVLGQRGRQDQAGIGHQAVVVEGHIEPVEGVR